VVGLGGQCAAALPVAARAAARTVRRPPLGVVTTPYPSSR